MKVIDIVQGFLGSGKTTLINHLIKEVFPRQRILVVQTEWGESTIEGFGRRVQVIDWDWESGFDQNKMKKLVCTPGIDRIIFEVNGMAPVNELIDTIEELEIRGLIKIGAYLAVFHGAIWQTMGRPLEEIFLRMAVTSQGFWLREANDELVSWLRRVQRAGCQTRGGQWAKWYRAVLVSYRRLLVRRAFLGVTGIAGMYLLYWYLFVYSSYS